VIAWELVVSLRASINADDAGAAPWRVRRLPIGHAMTSVFAPGDARRRRYPNLGAVAMMLDLAPVLAILLVSALGFWALTAYAEHRASIRTAETERYLEQFEHGPVADAWQRLRQDWQAETGPRRPVSISSDLASDVDIVLQYFRRLALCMRMGSCDPALTSSQLGDLPRRFRERYDHILPEADLGGTFDQPLAAASPHSNGMPYPDGSPGHVPVSN
jgi:hypothetical protein